MEPQREDFHKVQSMLERESRSVGPFDIPCIRCNGERCDGKPTTFGVCVPCLQRQLRTMLRLEPNDGTPPDLQ